MELTPAEFRAFWRCVHQPDVEPDGTGGPEPFAWQQRLVEEVAVSGRWPDTIDVPTGLGKTTVLDIAVYTLAMSMQHDRSLQLPRRMFFVIDRRIVVDQTYEHAQRIGEALRQPAPGSVAERVARLLSPAPIARHDGSGNEVDQPLVVGRMRGGTTWAWRWLQRPDQPAIIVGTIDQLGSRVLFDGYGVGETLRPIDAALTGSDSLVVIDEAHLAVPFMATLQDAVRLGAASAPLPLAAPRVVVMSATHPSSGGSRFTIEREDEMTNAVSSQRLLADKRLVTIEAAISKSRRARDTGVALATVARCLGEQFDVVGVVANTVASARAAFEALPADARTAGRCVLITGRQRPIDRDMLLDRWRDRILAGRGPQDGPLFVVATQTIEVGADLDFSALVTESASLDAVVQRLGRLNRRGRWTGSVAAIVHPSGGAVDDPIYGSARQATWSWFADRVPPQGVPSSFAALDTSAALDVGPLALADALPPSEDRAALLMPSPRVPVLFPGVLERWVRTSPRALDTPPTGPYLHGIGRDVPTVHLLWRHVDTGETVRSELEASLTAVPPGQGETIEVPLWEAQAWIQGGETIDGADLLVSAAEHAEGGVVNPATKPFVAARTDGTVRDTLPLRAGDTVVVPTDVGGLDQFGWHPSSSAPMLDVADLVDHQRRRVLRLDRRTLEPLVDDEALRSSIRSAFTAMNDEIEGGEDPIAAARIALGSLASVVEPLALSYSGYARRLQTVARQLADDPETVVVSADGPSTHPVLLAHQRGAVEQWSTDDSSLGTSAAGRPVSLDVHQQAVAERAAAFARALGLPDTIVDAVVLAAAHHDVGKCDPRFQRMLNGGAVPPPAPLAKSGMDPAQHWTFARSRQLAGYPAGMRHEAFSARAVAAAYIDHPEYELIVHLVATHHGRGRPLEAAVDDEEAIEYEVQLAGQSISLRTDASPDWSQPARFRRLNERFGPWGLAMLETIVRLADIGCSSEGS